MFVIIKHSKALYSPRIHEEIAFTCESGSVARSWAKDNSTKDDNITYSVAEVPVLEAPLSFDANITKLQILSLCYLGEIHSIPEAALKTKSIGSLAYKAIYANVVSCLLNPVRFLEYSSLSEEWDACLRHCVDLCAAQTESIEENEQDAEVNLFIRETLNNLFEAVRKEDMQGKLEGSPVPILFPEIRGLFKYFLMQLKQL